MSVLYPTLESRTANVFYEHSTGVQDLAEYLNSQ
jgi:hypothetical protein